MNEKIPVTGASARYVCDFCHNQDEQDTVVGDLVMEMTALGGEWKRLFSFP